MSTLALLTVVCMLTYTVEIVFGLAGTILMITIMSTMIDTKTLVIFSVLPQILVGGIGLYRSPRTVKPRELGGMLLFASFGGLIGLYLFYFFSSDVFHLILASAITLFGLYLVLSPRVVQLPRGVRRLLDVLAGASQALFGISGPIAMTRLLSTHQDKTVIRNYALAFFLSLNCLRLAAYLLNGTFNGEVLMMMAVSGPLIFLTLWYSNHLHMKVNQRTFRRVVSWLILLGGTSMLWQ